MSSSQQKILRQINQRIKQNLQKGELNCLQLDSICIKHITKQIKHMLQSHPHIEYLTMNDCQLLSLANFPKLDNLSILQLSNNQIQDDSLYHLLKCSHISHLMIDQNKLRNLQKISILRQLANLEQLEIAGNGIGDSQFYREELFDKIPQLKIIDCHDRQGNIAIDSQSEEDQQQQDKQMNRNYGQKINKHNVKSQENQLLDLLHDQQSQQHNEINQCVDFGKLRQEQNSDIENKQTAQTINKISGTKKVKLQQKTDIKNQKVFNKKTIAEYGESSSPELQFYDYKKLHSQDFQE